MGEWKKIRWVNIMLKKPTGKAREVGDTRPPRMALRDVPGKSQIPLFWSPRRGGDPKPWLDQHSGARYAHDEVEERPRGSSK